MILASEPLVDWSGFVAPALHLLLAGGLGTVVGLLYLFSTRHRLRTPGLAATLTLLSMLITLVTMAVGDNTAKAFTLVGTLAIVRFRTPVRDIRDTAYVIFSVAVGLAAGAFNWQIAVSGIVIVGGAILILNAKRPGPGDESAAVEGNARLDLRFDEAGDYQAAIESVLDDVTKGHRLIESRGGRDGGTRLLFAIDLDRGRGSELVDALHDVPHVKRVSLSFGENLDDDD